jgi:hypothetical protein
VQPRQTGRVAPIGLDPVAGPLWDQRGRDHDTVVPARREVTLNAIAARPRLLSFRHPVKRAIAPAATTAVDNGQGIFDQSTDAPLFGQVERSSPTAASAVRRQAQGLTAPARPERQFSGPR